MISILFLDLARRTGWARGEAGKIPISGSIELREAGDAKGLAVGALGRWLRDHKVEHGIPDLVGVERWMPPKASRSAAATEDALRLNGCVHGLMGGIYGCKIVEPYAPTIRLQTCGHAYDRDGDTKAMVLAAAKIRGLIPQDCLDHDRADAVLGWDFCAANYGRVAGRLVLTPA